MSEYKKVLSALLESDLNRKIQKVYEIFNHSTEHNLSLTQIEITRIKDPGRPLKPELVRFQGVPKRDSSDLGMIKTIHAICHIEFNAINLALDAAYRFQEMPKKFFLDWIKVAKEEATHFELIRNYLNELSYEYGDFNAHGGLWRMTYETDYDVLARMALVPRVLEARGLDVTPGIQKKFQNSKYKKMSDILDIIYRDEIGHVKIGNRWFSYLCKQRDIDPLMTFKSLVQKHIGHELRGPFNIEARKLSEFSEKELNFLESNF